MSDAALIIAIDATLLAALTATDAGTSTAQADTTEMTRLILHTNVITNSTLVLAQCPPGCKLIVLVYH